MLESASGTAVKYGNLNVVESGLSDTNNLLYSLQNFHDNNDEEIINDLTDKLCEDPRKRRGDNMVEK